jgi:hypothetical protein
MLLDAAVLTLVIGLLIGRGRITRLKDLDLHAPSVFILAAVVKVSLMVLGMRGSSLAVAAGGPINIICYLLILLGLWLNRRRWEMRLVAVGVLLNSLVIIVNGGSMPVDRGLAQQAGNMALVRLLDSPSYVTHKPVTERTRLRPLADVVPLPMLLPRPRFFSPGSIGDVLITAGVCWLILAAMGAFGLGGRNKDAGARTRGNSLGE